MVRSVQKYDIEESEMAPDFEKEKLRGQKIRQIEDVMDRVLATRVFVPLLLSERNSKLANWTH